MRRSVRVLVVAVVLASTACTARRVAAQEYIDVDGPLGDADFYRVVACGAPPGGDCAKPRIHWPADRRHPLAVGIAQVDPGVPDYRVGLLDRALDDAIAEINGAGADITLARVPGGPFDIPVYLVDVPQGGVVEGTGNASLDGEQIAIGRVVIRSRGSRITSAAIAISAEIRRREIASVMLEELVQSLGLTTDILGPAYEASIFAEDSNSTVWLRGQDAEALRRHYPR